ncbi:MAG: dTMP kinase [Deltaproteobacteria bacterium]|nr:dTMP kinase [Deltaproteobacteria bacterium]
MFITLEGIEGCGKTTQTHLLANWLRENKFSVVLTYEPGDTDLGNSIRSLILDSHIDLSPNTELFLYLADRIEHVRKVIKPALKGGKIVLCDRYHDATIVYQGYGRGISTEFIKSCFDFLDFPLPDLTLLLDCPVEIGLSRIKGRRWNRLEKEGIDFHRRVRKGYLNLAKEEEKRIKIIDATRPIHLIQEDIRKIVKELLI